MKPVIDAFFRAAAYCLHPQVIMLSLLPLLLLIVLSAGLGYFYWDLAVAAIGEWMKGSGWLQALLGWLDWLGMGDLNAVFAPLLLLMLATPVLVVLCLLLVSVTMTPAIVALVARRRFAELQERRGGGFWMGLLVSLGATLAASLALLLSMPFWLIPPLVLVLPPLIWGWLTYRVFGFDSLAVHASAEERHTLMRQHRGRLFLMGVFSGYLGAAPSVLWASGAMFIALAPLLIPVALWIYTLVLAFASLWFAHYLLAALDALRRGQALQAQAPAGPVQSPELLR